MKNLYDAAKQKCASIRRGPFGDVRTVYTRDGAGRIVAETTTAANCETQMVARAYDSRGRVTRETAANGSTTTKWTRRAGCTNLANEIRVDGQTVQTVNAACVTNAVAYDVFRRRVSETDGRGNTTTFTYDAHGRLAAQTDAATNTTSYAYDAMDRVKGSIVSQYDYTSDALGRRTQIAKTGLAMAENRTDTYGYNVRSELISAAHAGTNEYTYAYDDIGNRLSSNEFGTNRVYTANCLNQYEEISSDAQATDYPRFDLDGNQTNVTTRTGTWSVVYNGENRPILWTSGPTNLTMRYDFMGRRVEYIECVGEVTNKHQRFVYEGYLCIQRLNAPDNSLTDRFEWDPTESVATRPLWWKSCTNSGTNEYYYTLDGNKNVSEVFSFIPSLSLAAKYSYAPFGEVVSRGYNAAGMSNPWKFSSEYRDGALPFSFYMLRIYNAFDGRWASRDPLDENIIVTDNGGAGNLYLMSVNDTIGVIDLLGEKPAGRYFRKKLGHVESLTRRTDRKNQERQRFWSDAFDFFTDFLDQRPHLPGEDFISDGLKQCMKNHETGTCDACCILVGTIQSDVQFGLSPVLKSASLQCEKCDEARRRGWLIGHREVIKTIELKVDNCQ